MLSYRELLETNLKGYKFTEIVDGYTMTGWGTIDYRYVVLEDDGEKCVVADLDDRTKTRVWSKKKVSVMIERGTIVQWDAEKRMYINDVEQL